MRGPTRSPPFTTTEEASGAGYPVYNHSRPVFCSPSTSSYGYACAMRWMISAISPAESVSSSKESVARYSLAGTPRHEIVVVRDDRPVLLAAEPGQGLVGDPFAERFDEVDVDDVVAPLFEPVEHLPLDVLVQQQPVPHPRHSSGGVSVVVASACSASRSRRASTVRISSGFLW